jgi:hypothetical protein
MAIAEAITQEQMQPADLEAAAVEQCRELFATVYGPEDPLWSMHVDVIRQGLALGALSADEIAEWLAVARTREGKPIVEPEPSWIEQALAQLGDDEAVSDL